MRLFREAAPASTARNVAKTFAQIVVMWGAALWLAPTAIVRAQDELGIGRFDFGGRAAVGAALFCVCSACGVWAGMVMARRGAGTPLPLDHARVLVVSGPYAHLRNPMALCGVGQELSVGVWMGSWPVLAYAAAGALLWNYAARPAEEADLLRRFGDAYAHYQASVRCWIPRLAPYRPER